MAIYADRVRETTTTTGTGTLDLAGAFTGFRTFVSGIGTGKATVYTIENRDVPSEWEVGLGVVTDAATDTLSRLIVLASSNAGSLVSFSAGTKNVFVSADAYKMTTLQQLPRRVKQATTANITLSGEQTIDGVLSATSRILVKDQSTASQNGIYTTAAGAWSRAVDCYTGDDASGQLVIVEQGTVGADTLWLCSTNSGSAVVGTNNLAYTQVAGLGVWQPLDATLTALAGANWATDSLAIGSGTDTVAQVTFAANTFPAKASTGSLVAKTITDFALTVLDDTTAAAAATTLGLGTGNSVVFAGLTVDTNTLYVDATNNRIGVRTTSPQYPVHVLTAVDATQFVIIENTTNGASAAAGIASISQAGFTSLKHYSTTAGAYGEMRSSAGKLAILVGSTEYACFTTRGNLLIGTTTDASAGDGKCLFFGNNGANPTPGAATAGYYAKTVTQTEGFVVDSAGNATQLSPHPDDVIGSHAALCALLGVDPVAIPWGYQSEQMAAGVKITVDLAAALRFVEMLASERVGRPVELIKTERVASSLDWDAREDDSERAWRQLAERSDMQLRQHFAKPFWARGEQPHGIELKPPRTERPDYITAALKA